MNLNITDRFNKSVKLFGLIIAVVTFVLGLIFPPIWFLTPIGVFLYLWSDESEDKKQYETSEGKKLSLYERTRKRAMRTIDRVHDLLDKIDGNK